MPLLDKMTFACLDCETTGLDTKNDRIIEVACAAFTLKDGIVESFSTLIDPGCPISAESKEIHGISDQMVQGMPKIEEVISSVQSVVKNHYLVGHGINFDIEILKESCLRQNIQPAFVTSPQIDTLRLARLYGQSPTNSLEVLRKHFNIEEEGAHRAMNDVTVNIQVFRRLVDKFRSLEELLDALNKPILMKAMPLGKHKGRPFSEIPETYLAWASHQDFDQDLIFSIRTELKKRRKTKPFLNSANPFQNL